ncbi:MAG: putative bacteriophage related protein [Bryobacterales bacterium]|jgi:hypothetical protein|nr:putative bacteriophage related protein [Bryobacterales bacterium]
MTDRPVHPAQNDSIDAAKVVATYQAEQLHALTPRHLRERYRELYGAESTTRCKQQLVRRICWKLQALTHGDLSERARCRIIEISQDPELRIHLPAALVPIRRSKTRAPVPRRQPRERSALTEGAELRREYRGKTVVVKVLANGFEYEGQTYGSLSAVARAATGTRWNGLVFFGVKTWNESAKELARAAS